ncbi:hypothetical protein MKZ38_008829 [Zalerion maritima]|uniref:Mitochondrial acidic protein MAM33 n=1 Tax=Zalerion maritima TaxID=339359 RepID=A0AAD5RVY9_9PEZI|nr:hypothetical protein MKZ38_008829 [Zalerion maritima]
MLPMRAIARSGARPMPRLSIRTFARITIARPALKASAAAFVPRKSAFSTSAMRAAGTPSNSEQDLSSKLLAEIQFEADVKNDEKPVAVKEFLDNGPFKLVDNPGKDDVILTRSFGEETITVAFSIADLANFDSENDMFDDDMNDDMEGQRGEEDGEEGSSSQGEQPRPPCRLHIVIEKPGRTKGALNIEATAAEEGIMIESVYFYNNPELAHTKSPEAEFASQEVYPGPPFSSLDEDLQIQFERFLEERGINEAVGIFASEYMEFKEQREYATWLKDVKGFIDA